jgi:hypothetical protein
VHPTGVAVSEDGTSGGAVSGNVVVAETTAEYAENELPPPFRRTARSR